jgi:hypothetical protein
MCSCCYLPLRSRSRNTQHWRKSVLKCSPEPSKRETCCILLSPSSPHIPHLREIVPKRSPVPSISSTCCIPLREKCTLGRDGASTIARAFNLQLLLHTTQASFATYSTSARYCVHMKHYSAAAASHSAPIHNTLHIGERLCANARPSL